MARDKGPEERSLVHGHSGCLKCLSPGPFCYTGPTIMPLGREPQKPPLNKCPQGPGARGCVGLTTTAIVDPLSPRLPRLLSLKPRPDCSITDTIFFLPPNEKHSDPFSRYSMRNAVTLWALAGFYRCFSLDFAIFILTTSPRSRGWGPQPQVVTLGAGPGLGRGGASLPGFLSLRLNTSLQK